jgi:hypothetical protein
MGVEPVLGLRGILEHRHANAGGIDEHREEAAQRVMAIVADDEHRAGAERGAEADELEGNLLELHDRREEVHLAHIHQAAIPVVSDVGGDAAHRVNGIGQRHFPRGTHIG